MIKHLDGKQLIEERFYLACGSFQRAESTMVGKHANTSTGSRKQKANFKWEETLKKSSEPTSSDTSFSKAAPPEPPEVTAAGDHALKCLRLGDISHSNCHPLLMQMPLRSFPYLMGS